MIFCHNSRLLNFDLSKPIISNFNFSKYNKHNFDFYTYYVERLLVEKYENKFSKDTFVNFSHFLQYPENTNLLFLYRLSSYFNKVNVYTDSIFLKNYNFLLNFIYNFEEERSKQNLKLDFLNQMSF
jgi:hypothetical protein